VPHQLTQSAKFWEQHAEPELQGPELGGGFIVGALGGGVAVGGLGDGVVGVTGPTVEPISPTAAFLKVTEALGYVLRK